MLRARLLAGVLVVLALVFGLVAAEPAWALYPTCSAAQCNLSPGGNCTCPGGPPFISMTCTQFKQSGCGLAQH